MATQTITAPSGGQTAQVRIRLRTKSEDIQLPQDVGPILVSTDLRRFQLSTLVNRLLDPARPIPLEFLINGQFLRTSLDDFLTQNGVSAETTLSVEYVRALIPPLHVTSYEHDDWVSAIDVLSASTGAQQGQSRILSASFDGALRSWNSSGEVVATGSAHNGPVKAAKFASPSQVVSAGADRTLRVWNYSDSSEPQSHGSLTPVLELYGHTSSVDDLAVHQPTSRILSASSDHTVGIWGLNRAKLPEAPENLLPNSTSSNKRRKLSSTAKPVPQRGPLSLLSGHQAQVAAVRFDEGDSTVGYSASWDHSVRTWDLTTSVCVDTRTTSQALYSLTYLPDMSLLAAGTSARHITLIDPRASAATVSAMTLRGHSNAVSSLARDPKSTYQLVSGSHDGTCRIWDLRSVRSETEGRVGDAVYVIERESVKGEGRKVAGEGIKVFDVAWNADVGIVSAGEDKRVQINQSGQ